DIFVALRLHPIHRASDGYGGADRSEMIEDRRRKYSDARLLVHLRCYALVSNLVELAAEAGFCGNLGRSERLELAGFQEMLDKRFVLKGKQRLPDAGTM